MTVKTLRELGKLFDEIAYIDRFTLKKKPMKVLKPLDYVFTSAQSESADKYLIDLRASLERVHKSIATSFDSILRDNKTLEDALLYQLFEFSNIGDANIETYKKILELSDLPLFVRFDTVSLNSKPETGLPETVEFQFRIGGLGFHQAVNDVLGIPGVDGIDMVEYYAETIKNVWKERWAGEPFVQLLVPVYKAGEVFYWAKQLNKYGVKTQVVYVDNSEKMLREILKFYKKGARLIFRREFHLPSLLDSHLGEEIINLLLRKELRFDPPLSLFYDGKASSYTTYKDPLIAPLSLKSKVIYEEGEIHDYIMEKKEGIMKLGSGYDMYSSFGGRSVIFLKDLSWGQRENYLRLVLSKIRNEGGWYIWQPEIKAKVNYSDLENQNELKGRLRFMVFASLYDSKVIGFGANVYNKSKIIRGGHPIASVNIKS